MSSFTFNPILPKQHSCPCRISVLGMVSLDGMLSLSLTFWVVSIVNDITNVEITNSWVANNELCFNGVITNECAEDVTDGWKMYLKSSQRLSTLTSTNVTVLQTDVNSSFIFENLPWNSQCVTGEIIRVSFAGCTPQKDSLPQISIEFHRNEKLCPKITPPSDRQSIEVPTVLVHDDDSTFRASLRINLPVTVQGDWVIYLAVSTQLSEVSAAGVSCLPKRGDIFTLTNLHWQEIFMAGVTHSLEIDGKKATHGIKTPCITAMFTWEKDMVVYSSTMPPLAPSANQTISHTVQQTFTPTSSQLQFPSPSLSEIRITSSSAAISTSVTERLQSVTSLQTTYSKVYQTSSVNIQSSPTIQVQPSSTTTTEVGETILPHECGDVTLPSGYYHLETSVVVGSEWPQGFSGKITFTTTTQIRDGWLVELVMDKAISLLNVYTVTATASSGTRFTLHNKDYNKKIEEGTVFAIDFDAIKETENEKVPCMRAVFMWAIEEPCPKIDFVSGSNSINVTVNITSQWSEGVAGTITVVVPEEIRNGWQIEVVFDIPLALTVYIAISTPSTGTHFTLTNESYNKELQTGHNLVVDFTATKQENDATVLCADAVFHW